MRVRMNNEDFLRRLSDDREYKILETYVSYGDPILVENKYGKCLMRPKALLDGYNPSIRSAINPHEYFCRMVEERNEYYFKGLLKIVSTFVNDSIKLVVETNYGQHLISPYSLFHNNLPCIKTSLDKNRHIIKQFIEKHNNLYDYTKVDFKTHKKKVVITCKEHGDFKQTPDHHLRGYGCDNCANEKRGYKLSNWLKACVGEKGKFYVIKCFNEEESFYKIGITCQSVYTRYSAAVHMPYKYEIVTLVEEEDRNKIWGLEKVLKRRLKKNKYIPRIRFDGDESEVFEIDENVLNIINEEISSVSWN